MKRSQLTPTGLLSRAAFFAIAVLVLCSSAGAEPVTWDLVGDYDFSYYVQLGDGGLSLDITSEDFSTGAFTAISPDPDYTFSNGQFDGSDLSFDAVFNGQDSFGFPLTCDFVFDGQIASNGTFSGLMERDCAGHGFFHGSFSTAAGQATQVLPAFEILEYIGNDNCPNLPAGSTGCFIFVNNTSNYAVTGFDVGNSNAVSDITTRGNWSADITSINFGNGPEPTFAYFDDGGPGFNPIVSGSDGSFFFTTSSAGSPFEVFATGPNGEVSCIGTTGSACNPDAAPEPSSVWSFVVGFAALHLMLRARRSRS